MWYCILFRHQLACKNLELLSENASCPLQMAEDILLSYMIQHRLCVYTR